MWQLHEPYKGAPGPLKLGLNDLMAMRDVILADCWFLTGPTAGGKTAVGMELARGLNAEIVSLDSMALYRGMDIGTAKPTNQQRAAVAHHLIDVIEANEEYNVAGYVAAADAAVRQIASRSCVPLFVGGTPLYLKALLRGIFSGPPADWELRRRFEALAETEGNESLHARLAAVDPRTAGRLHPRDTRRVIRALEVFEKTGRSITELQKQFDRARPAQECRVFVLNWPREALVQRIDRRVEAMFAGGLVDEVRELRRRGYDPEAPALRSIGYREIAAFLEGRCSLAEAIADMARATRHFAKRQMTWFRGDPTVSWHDSTRTGVAELAAEIDV